MYANMVGDKSEDSQEISDYLTGLANEFYKEIIAEEDHILKSFSEEEIKSEFKIQLIHIFERKGISFLNNVVNLLNMLKSGVLFEDIEGSIKIIYHEAKIRTMTSLQQYKPHMVDRDNSEETDSTKDEDLTGINFNFNFTEEEFLMGVGYSMEELGELKNLGFLTSDIIIADHYLPRREKPVPTKSGNYYLDRFKLIEEVLPTTVDQRVETGIGISMGDYIVPVGADFLMRLVSSECENHLRKINIPAQDSYLTTEIEEYSRQQTVEQKGQESSNSFKQSTHSNLNETTAEESPLSQTKSNNTDIVGVPPQKSVDTQCDQCVQEQKKKRRGNDLFNFNWPSFSLFGNNKKKTTKPVLKTTEDTQVVTRNTAENKSTPDTNFSAQSEEYVEKQKVKWSSRQEANNQVQSQSTNAKAEETDSVISASERPSREFMIPCYSTKSRVRVFRNPGDLGDEKRVKGTEMQCMSLSGSRN